MPAAELPASLQRLVRELDCRMEMCIERSGRPAALLEERGEDTCADSLSNCLYRSADWNRIFAPSGDHMESHLAGGRAGLGFPPHACRNDEDEVVVPRPVLGCRTVLRAWVRNGQPNLSKSLRGEIFTISW